MLRTVRIMDPVVLATLSTERLLARLYSLLELEQTPELSDWTEEELLAATGMIAFKETPIWRQAHHEVKALLADREHVASAEEFRTAKAERSKTTEHRNGR